MKRAMLFFVILAFTLKLMAQEEVIKDSTHIISFVDKIILKANVSSESVAYILSQNDETAYTFLTNNEYRLSLSLDYEFIGFSFGFAPEFFPGNNDDDLKGKSSFTDYKFRFFLKKWTQEVGYSKATGFYLENTGDLIPDWTEGQDPYLQFPDLKINTWQGSTSYVFNDKFSLRNVAYNTEWQLESAGSFIPTLGYKYSYISARLDTSKIYEKIHDIRLSPDYYYSVVLHKNWFITPYISPSVGIRFSKDKQASGTVENNIYWPLGLNGGLQLGYSSRYFIFGGNLIFESIWYHEDSQNTIINDKVFAKFYFGYRLDTPKAIQKSFDWMNEKIGL